MSVPNVCHLMGILILKVAVASLSGCASQSRLAAAEAAGWRVGWVHQIVEGRNLKNPQELACMPALSADRFASSRFAVVGYIVGTRVRGSLTVLIPEALELKVGDEVQVNVRDCELSILGTAR